MKTDLASDALKPESTDFNSVFRLTRDHSMIHTCDRRAGSEARCSRKVRSRHVTNVRPVKEVVTRADDVAHLAGACARHDGGDEQLVIAVTKDTRGAQRARGKRRRVGRQHELLCLHMPALR